MVGLGLASYLVVRLSEASAPRDADSDETSENFQPDAENAGA
jgi:hypothetical protein